MYIRVKRSRNLPQDSFGTMYALIFKVPAFGLTVQPASFCVFTLAQSEKWMPQAISASSTTFSSAGTCPLEVVPPDGPSVPLVVVHRGGRGFLLRHCSRICGCR